MQNQLNLGIVGCGGMMRGHIRSYQELKEKGFDNFQLTATCDINIEAAEEMAVQISEWQGSKPSVYASVEELLANENSFDAVDISVVHKEHHTVALPFIDAGKHLTIEKPLGLTMRTAKMIMDAADAKGIKMQVAENYRRSPENRAINWAIKSGRIGKLRQIYWISAGERQWYWRWRDHVDLAGGGWSMDGGVHFADLFRYHVGEVRELYAVSKMYNPVRFKNREELTDPINATVEDTTMAVLTFENGVTGTWTSSIAAPGHKISANVIYGEDGSIHFQEGLQTRAETLTIEELKDEFMGQLDDEEKEKLFPGDITNTVATELKEFVDAVLIGSEIEITPLEGYKDEAISLALYESEELKAPVKIKDIEDLKIETYQSRVANL